MFCFLFTFCFLITSLSSTSQPSSPIPAWIYEIKEAVELLASQNKSSSSTPFRKVCYPEISCFTNNGPLAHTGFLPQSPEVIKTTFYAYTPFSTAYFERPLVIKCNNKDKDLNTLTHYLESQTGSILAIIVHGYGMSYKSRGFFDLKNALLMHSNGAVGAVVSVQWQEGARTGSSQKFVQACTNAQLVGAQLGLFLFQIRQKLKTKNLGVKTHCIGYSLGAHVCSFAGTFTQNLGGNPFTLNRITGLDPNWALFEGFKKAHLRAEIAQFVDIIHTSGSGFIGRGNLFAGEHGMSGAYGHADFYVNGGFFGQPMCREDWSPVCDHFASVRYFIATLTATLECAFIGFPVEKDGEPKEMGFWSSDFEDEDTNGKFTGNESTRYYLNTTDHYPYCDN